MPVDIQAVVIRARTKTKRIAGIFIVFDSRGKDSEFNFNPSDDATIGERCPRSGVRD